MLLVVIWNGIEFDLFFTQGNVRTAYMDSAIKDAKTVVSFSFTKLSTMWLWYHIHVWKRLMCVPGKNILKSSATSVTTLTHMDNRSFLTVLVRGMALLKTLQRPTL